MRCDICLESEGKIEMSFSEDELERVIEICKHMIGLTRNKPYHRHGKAYYKPYRNRFAAEQSGHKLLDKLPKYIITKEQGERYVWYYLTREGLDWLGRRLNITINTEEG